MMICVQSVPTGVSVVSIDSVTSVSAYNPCSRALVPVPCFLLPVGDNRVIPLVFEDPHKADFSFRINVDVC